MNILSANATTIPVETTSAIDRLNSEAWDIHITQPTRALELSNEAKLLSEEFSYQRGLAYALRNMGVSNRYLSNLETALSLSLQALDMFIQLGEKSGEAQAYVSIGAIYYYMGDYDRGLDYFLKGLHHGEEINNKAVLAAAYNGAGYIYSVLGDNKKGLDFLHRSLSLSKQLKNFNLESAILDSLAVVYMNDQQIEKARETYLECLSLSERQNNRKDAGYALFGIGELLIKQNKLEEAKEYLLKSSELHSEVGYKVGMANSLLQLGKIFFSQNSLDDAKKYLQNALDVGESIKAKAVIYEAHEAFSRLYESTRDFEQFANHYKLFHKYKSEVFKEEQETKQKYLTIQYEMEKLKQETEIDRLTNVVMKEKNSELEKKTEQLEQSYNSVSLLSKIGQDITSTLSLDTILNTVYRNVNEMMDATVFGIGIYNDEKNCIEYRLSMEKGKRYQPYERTMTDKNQFPVWCIENKKEVFINDIQKEYLMYLPNIDLTILSSAEMEDGSLPQNPHSLIYLPLMVKDSVIGIVSVQSYQNNAYTTYHLDILKTLASYTSAALYNARSYEALQQTLDELKVTQEQLIQSEKMASLGELTAGIAHEIQNPLNFVNNFSEINKELVDELTSELAIGNTQEAIDISRNIKENEEKIVFHGKRADAIVKNMLQHSKISSGKKEPISINALADEYLRLAYHGFRAKDKSFNAKFDTDFDDTIEKVEVVPQDIGRVLLNLINNAFYAVNEKQKQVVGSFEATVSLSTRNVDGMVELKIKDNGEGIPPRVLDKIFQPFFTTKPTGQGTGLGLSLSYDIIKAHAGEIAVDTREGEGTEFTILLPKRER